MTEEAQESMCIACGHQAATLLCDFVLGAAIAGYIRVGPITNNRFMAVKSAKVPMFTCDAPLCEDCAVNKGHFHASGKDGFTESIDHCPLHADQVQKIMPLTSEEIEAKRREISVYYRRKRIAVTS